MIDTAATLEDIAQRDQDIQAWAWLPTDTSSQGPVRAGPLAGLRFGVKDVMDVRGMPTRHGSALANVAPARFDAACVAMLRAAGAQPIGKTVTAEFAVKAPGPTRNPWNLGHTPGGSSSGSAAAVAAGMVPIAIGTQTGGSIIRPAAFNGVVGFKPGFGRVPRTGMQVLCDSLDTIGWFTPDVALARQVAEIFMGPASGTRDARGSYKGTGQPLQVAVLPALEVGPLGEDAMQTLKQAAEDLASLGAHTEWREEGERFTTALRIHGGIMSYELARGLLPILQGEASALRPQSMEAIEEGLGITPAEYTDLQHERQALEATWLERYSKFDVILTPSAPGAAPAGHASTGSSVFNRTWSLLGWPSVHLPVSQSADGLPLGVQLVGRPGRDLELLSLAEALHAGLDRRERKRPE